MLWRGRYARIYFKRGGKSERSVGVVLTSIRENQ